jgi:hypothetical protein
VFQKPAVLLPVPEPNNFAASQRPEVLVRGTAQNSFEVSQRSEVQEQVPGRNNSAVFRKPAGPARAQNSFSALRKLAAQVRAPEPVENKMAEKGQGKESAPERKPADD